MEIKDQNLLRPQGEDENGSSIESGMSWEKEKNMTRMKYRGSIKERSEVGAERFKLLRLRPGANSTTASRFQTACLTLKFRESFVE